MSIASVLVKNIFYPLWMVRDGNGGVIRYNHKYRILNRLSSDDISARQDRNLGALLSHATSSVPYYKDLKDRLRIDVTKSPHLGSLRNFPILTKEIIREEGTRLLSALYDDKDLIKASTGGSTGRPLAFYRDKNCLNQRMGQELFFDQWMGYDIGKKTALFVAASHYDKLGDKLKASIRNATCERTIRFDPHDITDSYMDGFAGLMQQYKPTHVKSFPNSIVIFSDYLLRNNIKIRGVESVSCTGENLYTQQRELIEKAFNAPVFEKYGTRESGVIACECSAHKGMHIFSEGVVFEVVDENNNPVGPGEIGRVLITDLFNYGMPLIRYEIGDMAQLPVNNSCSCGNNLPLIDKIIGRDRDILYDENNNPKPGYLFVEVINRLNLPCQLQIVQKSKDHLVLNIAGVATDTSELVQSFRSILGKSVNIEIVNVDSIPRDPSGKFSYVKSEISPPWRNEAK